VAAKIKFEFKDSTLFRIIHADGVFGGPTPSGDLYLSFYNEHQPMPESVVHTVDGDMPGEEIMAERVASSGIARTNEVGVVMSFASAVVLKEWLSKRIGDMMMVNPALVEIEKQVRNVAEKRILSMVKQ